MAQLPTEAYYPNVVFAPYEYREFPKMVYPNGKGAPVTVTSAEEERDARAKFGTITDAEVEDELTKLKRRMAEIEAYRPMAAAIANEDDQATVRRGPGRPPKNALAD